jgi:hypothetical protein
MKLVACVIMSGQVAPLRSLLDDARVNAANQRSGIVMGEFQLDRLTSHVALPLIRLLGLFLSVPYIVTRGLLPHFGARGLFFYQLYEYYFFHYFKATFRNDN